MKTLSAVYTHLSGMYSCFLVLFIYPQIICFPSGMKKCFGLPWGSVEILKLASLNTNVCGDVRGERSRLRAYHWHPNNEIKYGCLRANQCCVKKNEKTSFASVAKIKSNVPLILLPPGLNWPRPRWRVLVNFEGSTCSYLTPGKLLPENFGRTRTHDNFGGDTDH